MKALQKASEENIEIAREELEMAKSQQAIAAGLEKAAKIKNKLVKQQYEMAKLEEVLALKEVDMIKKKMAFRSKGTLLFEGEDLEKELAEKSMDVASAKLQGDVARLNKKIGKISVEIAKEKNSLAKKHVSIAKTRKTLGLAQQELVRATNAGASDEKIKTARRKCQLIEQSLNDELSGEWVKRNEVRRKQEDLVGLTKVLAKRMVGLDERSASKP